MREARGTSCTIMLVEEFRASDKEETVAKYLSEGSDPYRASRPRGTTARRGLHSLGFPLEMEIGIGNNASTLNTADLAALVFLFRDTIRNQATVGTGTLTCHRWRLCSLL